ncbi:MULTISPECIES: relaxase/mobilization nuclease domain-containing protein [unclassified Sulfitobacter]|uniref:relaxase/mobilization nuclease domain-containing protein n=1 Tax=unclassified Sulfitobacter TaxID=196795 RepID=UPI0004E4323B|nr:MULTISPECIES: relaxase/mobilization nuclease domain-containing protein [unclassified Sulfitobacter]PTA97651.1 endonuclease [Sulfitobacter sp. CB-A]ULO22157.1 relaxase/mobilization nuclease domain-containing protein [Sulfitobacter sp. CB2047]
MRLNDATRAAAAVDAVTGEVFRDGWSRIRGSMQGLYASKQKQMVRAAAGHRAAVFKAIRSGGTHNKSQLANQLEYLTTKSTHIVDSSGFLDGKSKLDRGEIKDLTERFAKRWDGGFKPKLGQTTHLLMSFPIGTRGEDVRDIATDVAERFFQTDEGHFDYIIAVHEDRDHPHAHLVLNRRSQEGEFFYLARNHRFNYDDFRLAMVEEAEKYGVRLEATRRVDRGEVHYPPRTREVYAAKEEGRTPMERERVGKDVTRTLAEIANTKIMFHSLAAEASSENREDIAEVLFRAGEVLAKGGHVETAGGIYMAEYETFEELRSRYAEKVANITDLIAAKPDAERPALEKSLNAIQARVQHMQPLGLRSNSLSEGPSEGGVYSEANIQQSQLERLSEPRVSARVDAALRGTGISTSEVVARMEAGAQNAALEYQWIADDLSNVAEAKDLNLERRADLEQARDILNDVHVQLGTMLEREGVLRRDGVIEEAREVQAHVTDAQIETAANAVRMETQAEARDDAVIESRAVRRLEDEQREYLRDHPELIARPTDVIRTDEEGRAVIVDQAAAERVIVEVDAARLGAHSSTPTSVSVARDLQARYPDMPEQLAIGLGDTYARVYEARDAEREENLTERETTTIETPELSRVLAHERAGELSSPFETETDREAFRTEVARVLDTAQLDRLKEGDSDALENIIEDRLDRLYVAKVYLQSDAATANSDALRQVVDELADVEVERHRAADVDGESERGQVH